MGTCPWVFFRTHFEWVQKSGYPRGRLHYPGTHFTLLIPTHLLSIILREVTLENYFKGLFRAYDLDFIHAIFAYSMKTLIVIFLGRPDLQELKAGHFCRGIN